jgi:hypothetical protein
MKGKSQLLFLVTGMLIYILDLTSDVWVAARHYRNDESKWFGLTVTFIVIAVALTNIAACLHASKDSYEGPCKWLWIFCFGCPALFRYIEELCHWKRRNLGSRLCEQACRKTTCDECKRHLEGKRKLCESIYSLAWLHLMQATTESAPQACLQIYVMLSEWKFPCVAGLSASVSLASLAWSVTALERARESKNNNGSFKTGSCFAFLAMQLFALISRLSAIVIFAYVYERHVLWVLAFHWLLVTAAIAYHRKDEFKGEGVGARIFMLVASAFTVYPLLLFASPSFLPFSKARRFYTLIASAFLALANVIMLTVSIGIARFSDVINVAHVGLLFPVAVACVLGGVVFETVFSVAYYRCCCRKQADENRNRNESNECVDGGDEVSPAENNGGFDETC